ncbi:hypothetical protein F-E9_286 [Faustovirus]|nr:hypothetical protein F-E9_286 [Faustovirus]
MNVIEHELATNLVALSLYELNIVDHGGEIKDGKLIRPGKHGCLLAHHNTDSEHELWWKCENYPDHVYHYHKMSIKDKINTLGQGCNRCRQLVVIDNKFSNVPDVQAYWNWEKNTTTPDKLSKTDKRKFIFTCHIGHNFERSCNHFSRGQRCSYCSGRKVLAGYNTFDLVSDAREWWDYDENNKKGYKITEFTRLSNREVNFKCSLGHKFIMACSTFTVGNRCGVCYGQVPLAGFNTFDLSPDASVWWDSEENNKEGLEIHKFTRFTNRKVNLKCSLGHKYKAPCADFSNGKRCPTCAGKKVEDGFNDFKSAPDVSEWLDHEENIKHGILIDKLTRGSATMVYMKCPKNHKFKIRCAHFVNGVRCKICSLFGCSKIAIEYINCIANKYGIFIRHGKNLGEVTIPGTNYPVDGYIEINNVKIVIEFHGELYHGFRGLKRQDELSPFKKKLTFGELYQQTVKKENKIRELGYKLVVMWEDDYKQLREKYANGDFTIPEIEEALAK